MSERTMSAGEPVWIRGSLIGGPDDEGDVYVRVATEKGASGCHVRMSDVTTADQGCAERQIAAVREAIARLEARPGTLVDTRFWGELAAALEVE